MRGRTSPVGGGRKGGEERRGRQGETGRDEARGRRQRKEMGNEIAINKITSGKFRRAKRRGPYIGNVGTGDM